MRLFIIASVLLALAACASNEVAKPGMSEAARAASCADAVGEDKLICHRS